MKRDLRAVPLLWLTVFSLLACERTPAAAPTPSKVSTESLEAYQGNLLSNTRLLRRIMFRLVAHPPTEVEYDSVRSAPNQLAADAAIAQAVDDALTSKDFYQQLVSVGHDYLRLGAYTSGYTLTYFSGFQGGELDPCPPTTLHAGTLGTFAGHSDMHGGDPFSICDDPRAPIASVNPWWAPTTTVRVIGRAGSGLRSNGPNDCGLMQLSARHNVLADTKDNPCSCGPNLIYCGTTPESLSGGFSTPNIYMGMLDRDGTPRRQAFEEGARLFAHIGWHDRPLTDLVAGNYTVAPLMLRFMYARAARMNPANASIDLVRWWDTGTWSGLTDPDHAVSDPLAWTEFVPHTVAPNMLSGTPNDAIASGDQGLARTYAFDPRVQQGEPDGMQFAGVLTSFSAMGTFVRERVRGARWMEALACRSFIPPSPDEAAKLGSYTRDPATEGVCQHCHQDIDPAAIFFKRYGFGNSGETVLGGLGPWRMSSAQRRPPFERWRNSFVHDTVLTPATEPQIAANPDTIFVDYQSADTPARFKLFGRASDGTIGPLGFAKLLVESGAFDECAVRKLYEQYVGGTLDPHADAAQIDALVTTFKQNDRRIRPFIKALVALPQMRRGL